MFYEYGINTFQVAIKSGQYPVRITWKPRRGLRSKNPKNFLGEPAPRPL